MDEKKTKALEKISAEIEKINKNENKIYFFVIDTKGNSSGSLAYIYKLALFLKKHDYNVAMLHQEDEFVGVGDWMPLEFTELPHYNISKDDIEVSPCDILFIPEIFAQVMNQTKKLPCKRIAILQNFDYMVEQMPFSGQWGDFGIFECVTNTNENADLIKSVFPYVKTTTIKPYIDYIFGTTDDPKKMIINIVARNQEDINKIVKPFYWKYPAFKWVSFRDLRGFSRERFAECLREAAITIWVDDETSFGYSAIEAMKSGAIVIAKIPDNKLEWMTNENGDFKNCCVWFDDFNKVQKQIASVVRSWITDKVPEVIYDEAKKVGNSYPIENTEKEFINYVSEVVKKRKNEMEELLIQIKNEKNTNENE